MSIYRSEEAVAKPANSAAAPTPRLQQKRSASAFSIFSMLVVAYVAVLLSRLPLLLFPPSGYFYNIDELEMTLSCLDRFIGIPSTSLQWPGSILQFLFLPVLLTDFALRGGAPTNMGEGLSQFAAYLSQAYANPMHSVLLLRWVVAVVSSAAPILAFFLALRLSKSNISAAVCAAAVALSPTFVQHSVMATGEAVSVTMALAALVCVASRSSERTLYFAGFLFAAGLAARITIASLVILPLLLILLDSDRTVVTRFGSVLRFSAGLVFGFLFWCPYVWTDPVRFGKAVVGHVKPGAGANLVNFLSTWIDAMGFSFSLVALMSLLGGLYVAALRAFKAPAAAALAATIVISLPLLLAKDIFPRYFLPLLPCIVVLAAITLRPALSNFHTKFQRAMVAVFIVASMGMMVETTARELRLRKVDELARGIDAIQSLPPDTVVYLPEEALYRYRIKLPRAAYERMLERSKDQLHNHSGLLKFLELRGMPKDAGEIFVQSFNEDEQAAVARLSAASAQALSEDRPVYFYLDPSKVKGVVAERISLADFTLSGALEAARARPSSAILLEDPSDALGTPVWKGERGWYLYKQ